MIVDAELLHDGGLIGRMTGDGHRYHYPAYMHIVEAVDDDEGAGRPWEGVAGRLREEMMKQRLDGAKLHAELKSDAARLNDELKRELDVTKDELKSANEDIRCEVAELKQLLLQVLDRNE